MSEWQKCPICDGVGQVSWGSSGVISECQTCSGKGIIVKPEPPSIVGQTANYDFNMTPEYIERDR